MSEPPNPCVRTVVTGCDNVNHIRQAYTKVLEMDEGLCMNQQLTRPAVR